MVSLVELYGDKGARILALRQQAKAEHSMVHEKAIEIYEFLFDFIMAKGYAPTYREIGRACKVSSTSLVSNYLGQLQNAGCIRRDENVARGIVLLQPKEMV